MTPQTKKEVMHIISKNLPRFSEFSVSRVGLFGSFVREEQTENSDIDLLVVLDNPSWDNFCHLLDFVETLFGSRETDIITKKSLNETSGRNILREVEYIDRPYR